MGGQQWTKQELKILEENYPTQGTNIPELDRSKGAIRHKTRRMGLSCDEVYWNKKLMKHVKMTDRLREYLNGLLLGDGCIINRKGATAYYRHTDKHKEYLVWLRKKLESVKLPCGNIYENDYKSNSTFFFDSQYGKELEDLYYKWYPNGKKKIPKDLKISPVILKNWYIGDGSYSSGKRDSRRWVSLYIGCYFDPIGKNRLVNQINEKTNIKVSSIKKGINIWKRSYDNFFNYILSKKTEIPPGYKYKFKPFINSMHG